jgi:histidinol-phosphate/aromatic aminotransferase/cobyric acid decarboxylase-like protein
MIELIIKVELDDGYFIDPEALLEIGEDIKHLIILTSPNNHCRVSASQSLKTLLAQE